MWAENYHMDDNGFGVYRFQRICDLILVIAIICLLVTIAMSIFQRYIMIAKIADFTGSPFIKARMDIIYYRAHHGVWPENNRLAAKFGWNDDYHGDSNYIEETIIDNGAVHFVYGKDLEGKILTLHPAVPVEDTLGPIHWICCRKEETKTWIVQGKDRTNIDAKFILRSWR
jgi:hypothetical protein